MASFEGGSTTEPMIPAYNTNEDSYQPNSYSDSQMSAQEEAKDDALVSFSFFNELSNLFGYCGVDVVIFCPIVIIMPF